MTKAEILATFIVENWHYCPLDDGATITDCEGWCSDNKACVKCICKHTDSVILNTDN